MTSAADKLRGFPVEKDFFIGIDSDGCVFDSKEVKHKACFYPATVEYWNLAGVASFARDVWDFVNLYGKSRGCNRFLALLATIDYLAEWDEVRSRGYQPPDMTSLRNWVNQETQLGNPALEAAVAASKDMLLTRTLAWSKAVNHQVERTVRGVPPFPHVRQCLQRMAPRADTMVVSATPAGALEREWAEHDIDGLVKMICGQELGKKSEHLQHAAAGRYAPEKMLMIGDAPGDLKAARHVGALFYPICPGREVACWQRLLEEGLERFFDGAYSGDYEQALVNEFLAGLPADPPWKG